MCISSAVAGVIAGVVSAIAAATSTAVSMVAANKQAKSQQAMYDYQAKVAEQNRKIAQENAADERQQGIEEARLQRYKTIQKVGAQQAAMAANGIDVSQGTAVDVIDDTATIGELDALQTRYNYERRAQAYEAEAGNFANQANIDKISAQNAVQAGRLNSISNGLAGVSSTLAVSDKWFNFGSSEQKQKNNNKLSTNTTYTGIWADAANSYIYG